MTCIAIMCMTTVLVKGYPVNWVKYFPTNGLLAQRCFPTVINLTVFSFLRLISKHVFITPFSYISIIRLGNIFVLISLRISRWRSGNSLDGTLKTVGSNPTLDYQTTKLIQQFILQKTVNL